MSSKLLAVTSVIALVGVLVLSTQGDAQIKKGKSRPLTTKRMMSGMVGPQYTVLKNAFQSTDAPDDKTWESLAVGAELLNETGHMLMDDGRCPDATWAAASKAMQEATVKLLGKIEAKDAAGARETFPMVSGSCRACHMVFKK